MVSGGATEAAARSSLVPMDGATRALIEHLVGPLLPNASSQALPTIEQQISVGKQMHSVVILYNYYYRKQFPELNCLDFRAFCKEATVVKPSLQPYMKFMYKTLEYPNDRDKDLSILEKEILDACNVSSALDATLSVPNMEGWLVSQVAVFLVDAEVKNCYLEYGSTTQGVWSLLEKKLDKTVVTLMSDKTKKKNSSIDRSSEYPHGSLENEDSLQHFALSYVEKKIGISRSNFIILKRDMTYSLSQVRATTKLYIIKSTKAVNGLKGFPIKDVLCSTSGPMLNPEVTSVIDYYHLLPYVNILSDWLSRNLQNLCQYSVESNAEDHGINESAFAEQTVAPFASAKNISKNGNEFTCKKGSNTPNRKDSPGEKCKPQVNSFSLSAEPDTFLTTNNETVYVQSTGNENGNKTKLPDVNSIVTTKCVNGVSLSIFEPRKVTNNSSTNQFQQPSLGYEDHVSRKVIVPVHFPADGPIYGSMNKVDELNPTKKPRTRESNDGETFGKKDASPTCQDDVSSFSLPLVPINLASRNLDEFNTILSSKKHEFQQASLRILQKRREDLVQKHRQLDEEIAQCEMSIQNILMGQGSMKSNADLIIHACNALCSSEIDDVATTTFRSEARNQVRDIKLKRLSEAIFRSRSSCQELDDICCENGWMLPRYVIVPSTAEEGFRANVTVKGIDFETNVDGDLKSSARDARLSAAAKMMNKLRSIADEQTRGSVGFFS